MWAKCSSYLHHHSTRPASKKNDGRLELCTLTYTYTYVLNLCHRRMQLCNTLTTLYIQYKVHGGAFDTPIKVIQIDPDTWLALQERFKCPSSEGALRDVYDGEGYKQHSRFLSQPANISLLLNTDGVAIYRSSKISIWPVWAVVNELPPTLR